MKFPHFWKSGKRKKKDDVDEIEYVLDCVRAKMYDECFRLEEEKQRRKGGVFGAE